jgi:hypothetical protein
MAGIELLTLKLIPMVVLTQRWPFELPQSVGTLSELSKFHLLVN